MAIIKLWRDNEKERWWVSEPVDEIMTHVVLFFFKSSEREREIERERETLNVSHGIPRLWGRVYITTETYTHALSHTHKKDTHRVFLIWNRKNKKTNDETKCCLGMKTFAQKCLARKSAGFRPLCFLSGKYFGTQTWRHSTYTHTHTVQHTTSSGMLSHVSVTHNNTKKECSSEGMSYVTERLCVFIFFFFTLMLMCCCRRHQKGFIW